MATAGLSPSSRPAVVVVGALTWIPGGTKCETSCPEPLQISRARPTRPP